jgi:hypothetical protein
MMPRKCGAFFYFRFAVLGSHLMTSALFLPNSEALLALIREPQTACVCSLQRCAGWESMTDTEWPSAQMQLVGTLRDPDLHEPTYEEHHPKGTRYDSPEAPIAVKYFPYNRCDVFACNRCQNHLLRYTEFGGYYVDHRARLVAKRLVSDQAYPVR